MADRDKGPRLTLEPPGADKEPLKVNIFEFMKGANSALIPLFPYLDEGAIVPCGTLFDGGPGTFYGAFEHYNDVDEVAITFAAEGSRYRPGFVRVGPRQHFVGNPFGPEDDQNAYALIVITQRQLVGKTQTERVVFRCAKCKGELLNHQFDATPAPRGKQRATRGAHAAFTTIVESVATYRAFNEHHRTCAKCGHVNPAFPLELWGVDRYASQSEKVRRGRGLFEAVMSAPPGEAVMALRQKRQYLTAREAPEAGPYDEFPTFPPGIDPQLCLSRNDRPQPFYLICEHDTVIVHMSGEGRVLFKGGPVNYHTLEPGDFVYVPARTPHRIVPATESVQYRFKPEHPGLEGVAWYCERCGGELWREIWDTRRELPQEGYLRCCTRFNGDAALRTCKSCGDIHPAIDLAGFRWAEIAAQLRSGAAAERPEPPR